MDGVDDLGVIDPLEINRGDPEVRVPELALNDDQRHTLVRHLHGVRVAELVVVPTSAQPPLCRPDGYAEGDEKSLLRRVWGPEIVGIFRGPRGISGECRGSVTARFGVEGFGAVDRLLFVGHVGG